MNIKAIIVVAVAASLSACAVQKVMQATGGSRADGTIDLSYEYGAFEVPKIDLVAALETAKQRCAAWGYRSAEAFGGQKAHCSAPDGFGGCNRTMVTHTYQCLDKAEN